MTYMKTPRLYQFFTVEVTRDVLLSYDEDSIRFSEKGYLMVIIARS